MGLFYGPVYWPVICGYRREASRLYNRSSLISLLSPLSFIREPDAVASGNNTRILPV